jgi:hypothetical protein
MNKLKVAKIIHLLDLKTNNHNSRLVEDSIMHTHQTSPKENVLATNPQVRSTVCRTRTKRIKGLLAPVRAAKESKVQYGLK